MESKGERLKKIRQEKGLSLEEVQKKTKIHLNILKAIEGDSLTSLSPVYLKGFLKIYCKFLRVDPKDYIPDFKETRTQVSNIIPVKYISDRPREFRLLLKTAIEKLGLLLPSRKFKSIFLFVLIIILLSLSLFNLGKAISSKRKSHLTQIKPSSFQKVVPTQTKPQKETTSVIKLGIRAKENCWISLKLDGRLVFQRVLEKGRFESWQAKERIELSLGNASAVELEVNGQVFSNLGRRGQVRKNILITKEGLSILR